MSLGETKELSVGWVEGGVSRGQELYIHVTDQHFIYENNKCILSHSNSFRVLQLVAILCHSMCAGNTTRWIPISLCFVGWGNIHSFGRPNNTELFGKGKENAPRILQAVSYILWYVQNCQLGCLYPSLSSRII